MGGCPQSDELEELWSRISGSVAPFFGRIDYGNLRSRISRWDCDDGDPVSNRALVYETPGGSTAPITSPSHPASGFFGVIDATEGELLLDTVDEVVERILPRIHSIPSRRRE